MTLLDEISPLVSVHVRLSCLLSCILNSGAHCAGLLRLQHQVTTMGVGVIWMLYVP